MPYTLPNVVRALYSVPEFKKHGVLRQPKSNKWVEISTTNIHGIIGVRVPIPRDRVCTRQDLVCSLREYHGLAMSQEFPKIPEYLGGQPTMEPLNVKDPAGAIEVADPFQFFTDTRPFLSDANWNGPYAGWFMEGDAATGLFSTTGRVGTIQYSTEEPVGKSMYLDHSDLAIRIISALWTRSGMKGAKIVRKCTIHDWAGEGKIFCAKLDGHPADIEVLLPIRPKYPYGSDVGKVLSDYVKPQDHVTINVPTAKRIFTAAKAAKAAIGNKLGSASLLASPQSLRVSIDEVNETTAASVSFTGEIPIEGEWEMDRLFDPALVIMGLSSLGKKVEDVSIHSRVQGESQFHCISLDCPETKRRTVIAGRLPE